MPSIAVDVLLCLVLVGGAYILFGRPALQQGGKPGGKKKKRSRGKKGQGQAVDAVSQGGSETKPAGVETAAKQATQSNGYPAPSKAKQRTTTNGQAHIYDANKVIDTSANNNVVTQVANDKAGLLEPVSSYASRAASHGAPPKPLAERRAKVQAKTVVDDMVEKDDALQGQKVFAQTMRIVKPQPAKPLLLDDGEDDEVDDEQAARTRESAWQSVPVSKKSSSIRITSSVQPQTSSQAAVGRSVPGLPEQTKKQRQNARKAAEAKAAKEQAEADRLQRLAAHKRALERERMDAQSKQKNKSQPPHVQKSRREEVGGGMNAAVYDGKLIWE